MPLISQHVKQLLGDCSAQVCHRAGFPSGTQGAGRKMTHFVVQSRY